MQISSALGAIRTGVLQAVHKAIDPVWLGDLKSYPISPTFKGYDVLSINTLHYPVRSDWVYFNSTIQSADLRTAMAFQLAPAKGEPAIVGNFETPSNFTDAMNTLYTALNGICNDAMLSGTVVRFAQAKGLASTHTYIEFTRHEDDNSEKLVVVMVIKSTT